MTPEQALARINDEHIKARIAFDAAVVAVQAALAARCSVLKAEIEFPGRSSLSHHKRELAALSARLRKDVPMKAVRRALIVGPMAELGFDIQLRD